MWFGWVSVSKRAINGNFRWSFGFESKLKWDKIDQSKIAQRGQFTLKSNLLSSKGSKESKTGQIYSKFQHKDEKIGTSNFALYRRSKEESLFELETAINRLMLQLQSLSSGDFRRAKMDYRWSQ